MLKNHFKNHWKKVLVAAYVSFVLVLSATVRAESFSPDEYIDLNLLEKQISEFQKNNANTTPQIQPINIDAISFSPKSLSLLDLSGSFVFDYETSKIIFISENSEIFEVQCNDELRNKMSSDEVFRIRGFVSSNENSFVNSNFASSDLAKNLFKKLIFVTSIEIQK